MRREFEDNLAERGLGKHRAQTFAPEPTCHDSPNAMVSARMEFLVGTGTGRFFALSLVNQILQKILCAQGSVPLTKPSLLSKGTLLVQIHESVPQGTAGAGAP